MLYCRYSTDPNQIQFFSPIKTVAARYSTYRQCCSYFLEKAEKTERGQRIRLSFVGGTIRLRVHNFSPFICHFRHTNTGTYDKLSFELHKLRLFSSREFCIFVILRRHTCHFLRIQNWLMCTSFQYKK